MKLIARGGMAEVWLTDEGVVLKHALPGFEALLRNEARILEWLDDGFLETGERDGRPFVAMRYVDGADLRTILQAMAAKGVERFPFAQAIEIGEGTARALALVHAKGVVHRDVAPANVMVTSEGSVKLVDFGVARCDALGIDLGASEVVKGRASYMSPEQARGEAVDGRSDVFALGVMLFELTTGRRLFRGTSELETLHMVRDREVPRPSAIVDGYSKELEAIVLKALAKDCAERFTATELAVALEGL